LRYEAHTAFARGGQEYQCAVGRFTAVHGCARSAHPRSDKRPGLYFGKEDGESSWELDAVEPAMLAELVRNQIEELIDQDAWEEVELQENSYRSELNNLANQY